MYDNIGEKTKGLAKTIFIVEAIGAVITGIALLATDDDLILAGLLTLFCGPLVAYVGSWLLYAFGQLVEDTHAMRMKICKQEDEEKARRDAEEKKCEVEEIVMNEDEEKVKREVEKFLDNFPYMAKPINFEKNENWEKSIKKLSYEKLCSRYLQKNNYEDTYRYMCYLEIINRNKS